MDLVSKYWVIRTVSKYYDKETDRRFDDLKSAKDAFGKLEMDLYRKAGLIEINEKVTVLKYF
jgi:hypothetical protein